MAAKIDPNYARVKAERDKLASEVVRMRDRLEGLNVALTVMDEDAPQFPMNDPMPGATMRERGAFRTHPAEDDTRV